VAPLIDPEDPEVGQVLEQTAARVDIEAVAEQLEALTQRLSPDTRPASEAEIAATQREVRRLLRIATKPLGARGWLRTGTRLIFDSPNGYWAEIKFDVRPGPAPVLIRVYAVVGSPYLSRVYDGGDGRRPRAWGSGHAVLLWDAWIRYDPDVSTRPPRLQLTQYVHQRPAIVLGQRSAERWLTSELGDLASTMEDLCSDRSMRDWLADHGIGAVVPLRFAVLLSRHLGDLQRKPELLERLRIASDASRAASAAKTAPVRYNDRGRDPLSWSHNRFMRFVDELSE
jgi:hypothetical protein